MITNSSKENCTHDMSASVLRTAVWRRQLCTRFPEDARNIRAAEKLEQLTGEITDLSDDAWTEVAPYYNWCSAKWSGRGFACIAACGFRNVKTLPAFVDCLKPNNNAIALKKINDAWKGSSLEAARTAAFDIGMLVAGCMLAYHKAKDNVRRGFE